MESRKVSVGMYLDGSVLTMPARLAISYREDGLRIDGKVSAAEAHPENVVRQISKEATEQWKEALGKMADIWPKELAFHHESGQNLLWVCTDGSQFGILWTGQVLACLLAVHRKEGASAGTIDYYLSQAAKLFGIEQIFLYGKRGEAASLPLLTKAVLGEAEEFMPPAKMKGCSFLFCGKFAFDKDKDVLGWFLHEVFGIEKTQFTIFMGMVNKGFTACVLLPVLQGKILCAEELYLGMECGEHTQMLLSGTFRFSFIRDAVFQVSSGIGKAGFQLEAFAKMQEPITLFRNFRIGDTALAIGVEKGAVTFRMFSNLYIGEIKVFGAVGVAVEAGLTKLDFLSAAITDITLSKLINNILGKEVAFAKGLDFLELAGLPLGVAKEGVIQLGKKEDVKDPSVKEKVVSQFNELVASNSFKVSKESVSLERINGFDGEDTVILTDKSRMRHYSIYATGKLSLQAQFYYSTIDTSLGDYKLKKGIFFCGSITLFQKIKVKALFSMSEEDGVLAYATIDKLNLGILEIGPSGLGTGDNPLSHFSSDNLLWLLMDNKPDAGEYKPKGAVFFLRAGRQDCQFYLDGKIRLFKAFELAARILYTNGTISIKTQFQIGSLIKCLLSIDTSYQNVSDANFSLFLEIDCTGLEKAMEGARKKINETIERLRNTIKKTEAQLTQAQNSVDELHSQIATLDAKIARCKEDIRRAKWYVKVFVATAKGIEIAAYEVAKGALYVSIGVAKAALEVAKAAVRAAGAIGEGVLRIVDGAINAAMNLFFLKYIRLYAAASASGACLQAEMEFVVLGKTIRHKTSIGTQQFFTSPKSALDNEISGKLNTELKDIEQGKTKSNRRRYIRQKYDMLDYQKLLEHGMEQLQGGSELLQGMSEVYMEHCGEMLPEYEHYSNAYAHALGEVESVMALANEAVDFQQMNKAVEMMQENMQDETKNFSEEEVKNLTAVMQNYKQAAELAEKMKVHEGDVNEQKRTVLRHLEGMKSEEKERLAETPKTASVTNACMEKVLNDTEELLYQQFPPTRTRGNYIHLARESRILHGFDEIRKEMNLAQSESVRKTRSKQTVTAYEERL